MPEEEILENPQNLESKEEPGIAKLDVHINKEELTHLATAESGLRQNLRELAERLSKLPEDLHFEPGITLIVGDNGSGKSTLAKAIYLSLQYQEQLRSLKEKRKAGGIIGRGYGGKTDDELEEVAREMVFNPSVVGSRLDLINSGLAPQISKALRLQATYHTPEWATSRSMRIDYDEFPLLLAEKRQGEAAFGGGLELETEHLTDDAIITGSHRQLVDLIIFQKYAEDKQKDPNASKIYFLDEPETGLSPRRHLNLQGMLDDVLNSKSISVVPTNSTVLYQSDLPRIDLDFPARGIFRPSQYPEPTTPYSD